MPTRTKRGLKAPKYTPEIVARLLEDIERGFSYATAADYAGITSNTLTAWLDKYPDFNANVKAAERRSRSLLHDAIKNAGSKGIEIPFDETITKQIPITDKDGNFIRDEDGEILLQNVVTKRKGTRVQQDWRAGAWLLSRRFREDYAPPKIAEIIAVNEHLAERERLLAQKEVELELREAQINRGKENEKV